MPNVTVVLQRSDLWPVTTNVEVFPATALPRSGHGSQKPAGPATTSATVDAAGKLTLSLPTNAGAFVAWAQVGGAHRTVLIGDPTPSKLPDVGTLSDRRRRRRAAVGV